MNRIPDGWYRTSLSNVACIQTGIAKGGKPPVVPVEVPYLRVANVQDGYLDLAEVKTIHIERDQIDRYLLQDGDVILTEGGDSDKLGRGTVWRGELSNCIHQNHVFAVRLNQQQVLPEFFAAQAASPYGRRYFLSCAKRTTNLASVNKTQLSEFPVLVPPLPEQRKIAQILRTWDEAIAAAEQLVAALQRRKKGLMQRLLTGQVRFPEFHDAPWEEVELGDHLTPVLRTESVEAGKEYRLIGVRWYLAGAHIHDVVPGDKIVTQALSRIEENDILYNKMWVSMAAFAVAKKDHAGAYGSGEYPQFIAGDGIDVRFIEYAFHDPRFLHDAKALCRGTTGRIRLHPDDFLRLRMRMPSRSEQGRIAQVLQVADQEIDTLKQYLDGLRSQKKGLMQRLLTGQVRVQM